MTTTIMTTTMMMMMMIMVMMMMGISDALQTSTSAQLTMADATIWPSVTTRSAVSTAVVMSATLATASPAKVTVFRLIMLINACMQMYARTWCVHWYRRVWASKTNNYFYITQLSKFAIGND